MESNLPEERELPWQMSSNLFLFTRSIELIYTHTHTRVRAHMHIDLDTCRCQVSMNVHNQSSDDLRWSKQCHGRNRSPLRREKEGGGIWTYSSWRHFGPKANICPDPAFELTQFELIRCFFNKEKEGFWLGHDQRFNLSSIWTYLTWTYQAWTVCCSWISALFKSYVIHACIIMVYCCSGSLWQTVIMLCLASIWRVNQ